MSARVVTINGATHAVRSSVTRVNGRVTECWPAPPQSFRGRVVRLMPCLPFGATEVTRESEMVLDHLPYGRPFYARRGWWAMGVTV